MKKILLSFLLTVIVTTLFSAQRYFINGGVNNNWSSTTNWSTTSGGTGGSAIPAATDDVIFDVNSPNCTLDVSTAKVAKSLDCTNYTNTLTFNVGLTVSGNITLGSSMSFAGTAAIACATTGTWTSNGKTISIPVTITGTPTITLADNWTVTGVLTLGNSTNALIINGNTLNIGNNLIVGTTGIISGSAALNYNGTGTWSGSGQIRNNFTINTSGTLTVSGTVAFNTGILTYTAGTVVATGSTLNVWAGTTTILNTSGMTWNNVFFDFNITVTLTSVLNVGGTLSAAYNGNPVINGNNINAGGDVYIMYMFAYMAGTALVNFNGTGTWHGDGRLLNNLKINTSGTLTISGVVHCNNDTITYVSGTVVTTGSSLALNYVGSGGVTFNTGSMIWNNIYFYATTYTLLSDLHLTGTLDVGFTVINGPYNIYTGGVNAGGTGLTGTAKLIFNGMGSWTSTGAGSAYVSLPITINTTGTLTIPARAFFAGGKLVYVAGTVTTTGSILTLAGNDTIDVAGVTWNNFTIGSGGTILTLLHDVNVGGTFATAVSSNNVAVNGANVNINGNCSLNPLNSCAMIGTSTLNFIGTDTISMDPYGSLRNNITFNTASAVTIKGLINYNTGTITYTAGTVNAARSVLYISGTTTLNTNGMSWDTVSVNTGGTLTFSSNITITGPLMFTSNIPALSGVGKLTSVGGLIINSFNGGLTINLINDITVNGNLYIGVGAVYPIVINNNKLNVTGSLYLASGAVVSGSTNIVMVGKGILTGPASPTIRNDLTFNTSDTIIVSGTLNYTTGILKYTAGTIVTTGSTLNLGACTVNTYGINWNNVSMAGNIALLSSLNINGDLNVGNGTSPMSISGSDINAKGNLTVTTSGAGSVSGTSLINLIGTGTWSGTGILRNNLKFNTSGTITVSGTVNYYTDTITYVAGTIATTGSTLLLGGNTALNTNGMTWNNVTINAALTLTMLSAVAINGTLAINANAGFAGANRLTTVDALNMVGNVSATLLNDLTVVHDVSIGSTGTAVSTLNGYSLNIGRNLTINASGTMGLTGTTVVVLNGTGTLSNTGTAITTGGLRNNLTINTTGTITISGIVNYNTGTLNYTAGTVTTSGSTLNLAAGTILNTSGITWHDVKFAATGTYALSSALNLDGTLTTSGATVTINGSSINTGGLAATGTTINGTSSSITFNGTGTWSGSEIVPQAIAINTSGTLTVSGTVATSGALTYTIGTVTTTGYTINFSGPTFTINHTGLSLASIVLSATTAFNGSYGFNTANLTAVTPGKTYTFSSGKTYGVTSGITLTGTAASRIVLVASTAGSQANLNLTSGATQDVSYVNTTDINSSAGAQITDFKGVLTNATNWRLLSASQTVAFTF